MKVYQIYLVHNIRLKESELLVNFDLLKLLGKAQRAEQDLFAIFKEELVARVVSLEKHV